MFYLRPIQNSLIGRLHDFAKRRFSQSFGGGLKLVCSGCTKGALFSRTWPITSPSFRYNGAMRIRAASLALNVPVPTLRRWTQEFALGLSPEARASEGRPRTFTPRDMRVLRRAKEVLGRDDVTYESARRDLLSEGLLSFDSGEQHTAATATNSSRGVPAPRDEAAERGAAERFVRDIVERNIQQVRDAQTNLTSRVTELEREIQVLREQLGARGSATVTPEPDVPSNVTRPSPVEDAERRRSWRFR